MWIPEACQQAAHQQDTTRTRQAPQLSPQGSIYSRSDTQHHQMSVLRHGNPIRSLEPLANAKESLRARTDSVRLERGKTATTTIMTTTRTRTRMTPTMITTTTEKTTIPTATTKTTIPRRIACDQRLDTIVIIFIRLRDTSRQSIRWSIRSRRESKKMHRIMN